VSVGRGTLGSKPSTETRKPKFGLASTAKVFRSETCEHKIIEWGTTWMSRPLGKVGWSLFNQGWFKSRAVSSRKQGHRVSTLGLATTLGLICKQRRMRVWLRSTNPFFSPFFLGVTVLVFIAAAPASAEKPPTPPLREPAVNEPPVRDPRVLDAAKMYEKYFLGQMMKAMRSTVSKSELEKPSMGEGIYREQLDDQYVDSWGERGGIGLADMIHDELVGKAEMMKMRRQAMKDARKKMAARASGDTSEENRPGMALTDRDVLKVRRLPSAPRSESSDSTASLVHETILVSLAPTKTRAVDGPESVRSPWAGRIESVRSDNGKVVLGLLTTSDPGAGAGLEKETAPARKVELAFDGVTISVTVGDLIQAGQTLGHLAPGARGIIVRQTLVQKRNSKEL